MERRVSNAAVTHLPVTHIKSSISPIASNDSAKSKEIEIDTKVSKLRRGSAFTEPISAGKLFDTARRGTITGAVFKPAAFQKQNFNLNWIDDNGKKDQQLSIGLKDTPRRTSIFKNPSMQHNWQSVSPP